MTQDGFDGANVLLAAEVDRTSDIVSTDATNDEIIVSGDLTGDLSSSPTETQEDTETDTFTVENNSDSDNNQDYTVSSTSYDSTNDETTIGVSGSVSSDTSDSGNISYSVFADVAVQSNLKHDSKAKIITANHKKKGFKNKMYGKDDGSFTLNALELPPSRTQEALDALETAKSNENEIKVRRRKVDPDTDENVIEEAPCLVSNISKKNPDNDASNYSADLEQNDYFTSIS